MQRNGERPRRVVIDTDPGIDDAAALMLAFSSPRIDVVGITTVAGNVSVDKTTRNALRICELCGVDVPVAAGAPRPLIHTNPGRHDDQSVHGEDGLGGHPLPTPAKGATGEHAIELIARLAKTAPVTIIAIAPLTNLALFLARYPELADRIEELIIMGGARLEGNSSAAAEFNIWCDPEAASRVMSSGIPITLLPLDITHQAILTADEVNTIADTGSIGEALADWIRFYEGKHSTSYGQHFAPLHDVLTTLYLTHPQAMTFVDAEVTVDSGDSISRGATLVNTSKNPAVSKNAAVGVDLDRDAFAQALTAGIEQLEHRKHS